MDKYEQYKEIYAWKCHKCGRVLTTQGGVLRHMEKCQYNPPVIKGQVSMFEERANERQQQQNHT